MGSEWRRGHCRVEGAWDEGDAYELITLDIRMPGLDGHQVLKAIRAREEEKGIYGLDMVSVIMVSTHYDAKNIIDAFHKGLCDVYLIKPVDLQVLQQKMAELGFQPIVHGSEPLLRKRING